MVTLPADPRRRFFDAAHDILASDGYGALKLAELCRRVGVTTGAFYYSFDSWQDFTDQMLTDWLEERTRVSAELARRLKDPVNQLETLLEAAVELRHGSEAAIRAWAGADPRVAEVQAAVDEGRFEVVHDVMCQLVGKRDAKRFAWWGINVLVGFEQSGFGQTPDDLRWQLDRVFEAAVSKMTSKTVRTRVT